MLSPRKNDFVTSQNKKSTGEEEDEEISVLQFGILHTSLCCQKCLWPVASVCIPVCMCQQGGATYHDHSFLREMWLILYFAI